MSKDMDEHLKRMSEPEPYRSLRLQRGRLEAEAAQAEERALYEILAEAERKKIKDLGGTPTL